MLRCVDEANHNDIDGGLSGDVTKRSFNFIGELQSSTNLVDLIPTRTIYSGVGGLVVSHSVSNNNKHIHTNTSVQTLPYNPPVINYHHTPMAPKLTSTASMASSATSKAPAKTTKDKKKFSKVPADGKKRKHRTNCKKTYSSYTYKGTR